MCVCLCQHRFRRLRPGRARVHGAHRDVVHRVLALPHAGDGARGHVLQPHAGTVLQLN